jgi:transglutaminase-like putative cysteine protease
MNSPQMTGSARMTLLAALAVLLTASALHGVYRGAGWVPEVAGVVLVVAVASLLARRLRVPALLQPAWGVLAGGLYVSVVFAAETLALGLVPTRETAVALGTRIGEGLLDVEELVAPVPTRPGLVLLAVLGVGAVAVLVDLVAVALRRPAPAGLLLLVLLVVPAGTLEGGVGWWPFALGASGWLAMLMADSGDRLGRWGTALRAGAPPRGATRSDDTSLARVGRRIGVAALGVAVVVPALLPGLEARLLTGAGGFGGSRTTTTYNPITQLGGQLRLDDPEPLLAYTTTDPEPDYLRLTTLDVFDDDSGWSSSGLQGDVDDDLVRDGVPTPTGLTGTVREPFAATVEVLGLGGQWLPAPATPTDIEVEGAWLWDAPSSTVFSTRTSVDRVDDAYELTAERVLPSVPALRDVGAIVPSVQDFAVPPDVTPYVRELTAEVVAGAQTPYDQVAALQDFFRGGNGFVYSEDAAVPSSTSPNGLETFLRQRRGFCEQYASAMAAMVRLLGLPARVAVGFTPGTRQSDGSYLVTTFDAHAWPEVWFLGEGWVRFEPTPRTEQVTTPRYTDPSSIEDDAAANDPAALDPAAAPPVPPQAPSTAEQQRERLVDEDAGLPGADGAGSARAWWVGALVAAAIAAVLAAPAAVAALRRRRRWALPSPEAAWEQVREDAVDVGHRLAPAESPRAAGERLVDEQGLPAAAADAVRRIATEVEWARYAKPAAHSAQAPAAPLHRDATTVRAALLSGAGRRARWTARLAPPSTLHWTSATTGRLIADALDRADDAMAAGGQRVRRLGRRPRSA